VSGSKNLEVRDTRHLYLLQTKLEQPICATGSGPRPTGRPWPVPSPTSTWTKGLIDRGITRDLAWGMPVVEGRLSAPGHGGQGLLRLVRRAGRIHRRHRRVGREVGETWRDWWRLDEGADDVRYVQFMGKDNVAFHTVSFPATILGSGEPWKTVDVR
jgi:methionyl-tRNA synthetase